MLGVTSVLRIGALIKPEVPEGVTPAAELTAAAATADANDEDKPA